ARSHSGTPGAVREIGEDRAGDAERRSVALSRRGLRQVGSSERPKEPRAHRRLPQIARGLHPEDRRAALDSTRPCRRLYPQALPRFLRIKAPLPAPPTGGGAPAILYRAATARERFTVSLY